MILYRVDDRLIHGQITEGWLKMLDIKNVVICSSEIKNDKFRTKILRTVLPKSINLHVISPGEEFSENSSMILFENISTAYKYFKNKKPVKINIGGVHYGENRKKYGNSVWLKDEEVEMLKELKKLGFKVVNQPLPNDEELELKFNG